MKQKTKMMIMSRSRKKMRLVEEDYTMDQSVNKSAEYLMKRLQRHLSPGLVNMLIEQMLGFNEWMQQEMAYDMDLFVREHEVRTTGCPSVDYVLDVCYMWIAAEKGDLKREYKTKNSNKK